jgi:hypothetical protein
VREEAAPGNEVLRAVKLEDERLTRLECPKESASSRLPEVGLIELRLTPEEAKPLVVGDRNVEVHAEQGY